MQTAQGSGRDRDKSRYPLESSVCPWHLPPCSPTEPAAAWGCLQVVGSGYCGVFLQLKSKWDEFIFTKGCIQALEGWLPRNIYIVAGIFIAISLLQVCSHAPVASFPLAGCTCSFDSDFTCRKTVVAKRAVSLRVCRLASVH